MDSFVWAISEITPSVIMRRTKYWEPSFTEEAYLKEKKKKVHCDSKRNPFTQKKLIWGKDVFFNLTTKD